MAQTNQDQKQTMQASVGVSLGSTTAQGWYLTEDGKIVTLFGDDSNVKNVSINSLKASKDLIKDFFNYLLGVCQDDKQVIFFNSIGYSIDGGKKKGADVGVPFALVEDMDKFSDTSLMSMMAEVVSENTNMANKFAVINRNWKTTEGEEISGQWAKQIQDYLVTKTGKPQKWMIDMGGKSATLYHFENDIFIKQRTCDFSSPNDLISEPHNFVQALDVLLTTLTTEGINLDELAILQTGEARGQNIQGIFAERVFHHSYLPHDTESEYEALDFMRTVLKTNVASGFTLTQGEENKMEVSFHSPLGMMDKFIGWFRNCF